MKNDVFWCLVVLLTCSGPNLFFFFLALNSTYCVFNIHTLLKFVSIFITCLLCSLHFWSLYCLPWLCHGRRGLFCLCLFQNSVFWSASKLFPIQSMTKWLSAPSSGYKLIFNFPLFGLGCVLFCLGLFWGISLSRSSIVCWYWSQMTYGKKLPSGRSQLLLCKWHYKW